MKKYLLSFLIILSAMHCLAQDDPLITYYEESGYTSTPSYNDNARAYLKRLEEVTGTRIDIISTGADRAETIILRHPFH